MFDDIDMITTETPKDTELYNHLLSGKVIGCAIEVHRQLGPGLLINFNVPLLKEGIKKYIL